MLFRSMKPAGIKGVSAAGWSDAAVIVPWRLYQAYGDIRILEENYELMSRYMKSTENCVAEIADNFDELTPQRQAVQKYLWNTGFQYGDWLMPSIQMSGRSIFEVVPVSYTHLDVYKRQQLMLACCSQRSAEYWESSTNTIAVGYPLGINKKSLSYVIA